MDVAYFYVFFALVILIVPAILGPVLGHFFPQIQRLVRWGSPICLLFGPAYMVLNLALGTIGADFYSRGLIHTLEFLFRTQFKISFRESTWLLLILVIVVAGCAVFCAFSPNRAGYVAAALGSELWMCLTVSKVLEGYLIFPRTFSLYHLFLALAGIPAVVLSFMGLFLKQQAACAAPPETGEPEAVAPIETASAGSITILAAPFAGQQIPLPSGEELIIGSDASQCHLILNGSEIPPQLCSIRWLEGRNTYLVSTYAPDGLLYSTGMRAPSGSIMEVFPNTICSIPATGEPVVQVG